MEPIDSGNPSIETQQFEATRSEELPNYECPTMTLVSTYCTNYADHSAREWSQLIQEIRQSNEIRFTTAWGMTDLLQWPAPTAGRRVSAAGHNYSLIAGDDDRRLPHANNQIIDEDEENSN